jgi:hypothetical protein
MYKGAGLFKGKELAIPVSYTTSPQPIPPAFEVILVNTVRI